ncbi:MAG: malate synthase A [Deltaproteobacteria bacterium]|nr:malate synthase A [Deltaproteobacteria bacterium]
MQTVSPASTPPRESSHLKLTGPYVPGMREVLTPQALEFLEALLLRFEGPRRALLAARATRNARYRAGELPSFDPATREIREGDWTVAPLPADLLDRRVEITGPVDRKMIINALNSGADVFMADFEDSSAPTWTAMLTGQKNLRDAIRRDIDFEHPLTGKSYALKPETATLMVRPRGWHLDERNLTLQGRSVSGSLVDFGLYFFHNADELIARGAGPYFYLPKLEHASEAKLWNDVFVYAQEALGVPLGSIKATVLIETLPGAFQMDEILHALRQHSAGLNCGRWDYIFSVIKTLGHDADFLLPDRAHIGMTQPLMQAYSEHVVRTCHRRGVHGMGGMAAQIPIKGDPEANEAALNKVRADKRREVEAGHDGTWVAHPGLVAIAREQFAAAEGPNQLHKQLPPVDEEELTALLVALPTGARTEAGLRQNVVVGVRYLEAWLRGIGCVPLFHLMEDAATAEISRSQLWQWVRFAAPLDDGRVVDADLVRSVLDEELAAIEAEQGSDVFAAGRWTDASELFFSLVLADELADFLTVPAYDLLSD